MLCNLNVNSRYTSHLTDDPTCGEIIDIKTKAVKAVVWNDGEVSALVALRSDDENARKLMPLN